MNTFSPLPGNGPPRFEDFEYAMPSLPQQPSYPAMPHFPGPSSYGLQQPEHESNLSDLSSKMNSFLTEMDTQIVIHGLPDQIPSKRQRRLPPELELDAADFSAAATLSRVPSAANSRAPTPAPSPKAQTAPEQSTSKPAPAPKKSKPKVALTADQKRLNHLESEKKRRDMIKESFKELVELVTRGEAESGISPFGDEVSGTEAEEEPNANGKRKKKPAKKATGRGRRGEVFSGATKNRFIGQAIQYVEWLKNDTARMQAEVEALENIPYY